MNYCYILYGNSALRWVIYPLLLENIIINRIQQKGLLSVIGFGVLIMSLLLIVWAIIGLIRFFLLA